LDFLACRAQWFRFVFVGFVQPHGWPLLATHNRLCSIDNRLVDVLLSFFEFVGFLELVNPLNKNEITSFTLSIMALNKLNA
jgi:hypothetical protein